LVSAWSLLAAGAAFIAAARFCAPYRLATDGFQTEGTTKKVVAGLDPATHREKALLAKRIDTRVKPAYDDSIFSENALGQRRSHPAR
jgi:hypothetical protein